jgi:hypothetical protein
MRQPKLSGIVKRRFVHCVNNRHQPVAAVVTTIGISPGELCQIISDHHVNHLPVGTYYRIARWLQMPLANVVALAGARPRLEDLVRLGMRVRGQQPTSTQDQANAANEAGLSVAVFRRALHGYSTFSPSLRTCDKLATWLTWTGFDTDDIAYAAGMVVRYRADGRRVTITQETARQIKPYPCACGRAGCMVPAHIPSGPHRKWRSDACRMWAKRKTEREARVTRKSQTKHTSTAPPHTASRVRFITINERPVPVHF